MMYYLLFYSMIALMWEVLASDLNLLESLPNDMLFDETMPASEQIPNPQDSGPSDLGELTMNSGSSIFNEDTPWSFSSDPSIAAAPPINELFLASDPLNLAACLTSDNNFFPSTAVSEMTRVKRQTQCKPGSLDTSAFPKLSIPTFDDIDSNLREGILRENPALNDAIQRTKENGFENNVCILLTSGVLPCGACTSETSADWFYLNDGRFYWAPKYLFTLWNLANVRPGMTVLSFQSKVYNLGGVLQS